MAHDFYSGADDRAMVDVPQDNAAPAACTMPPVGPCLYRPPLVATVEEVVFDDDVSYLDVLGRRRFVSIAVYRAPNLPRHAPVVLMSHGGAQGVRHATKAMQEWASIISGAGYVVISLAHDDYPLSSNDGGVSDYELLCDAVGVPRASGFMCDLKVNWARPYDLQAVLSWLGDREATNDAWAEAIDLKRVAHFGHSAGAGAALMAGGVTRNFLCAQPFGANQGSLVPCSTTNLVSRRIPQIRAIVAFSPQGPGSDGFMTESYASLAVPMLMASGRYDGDVGEPQNRVLLWDLVPGGERWKVFLDHDGAQHGLLGGNLDPCINAPGVSVAQCQTLRATLRAAALAFLDAQLRQSQAGRAWLGSHYVETLSGGASTLVSR